MPIAIDAPFASFDVTAIPGPKTPELGLAFEATELNERIRSTRQNEHTIEYLDMPLALLTRALSRVACLPFPPSFDALLALWVLYTVVEYALTDVYLPLGRVWQPAFPLSWRIACLALVVVPATALVRVIRLVCHSPSPTLAQGREDVELDVESSRARSHRKQAFRRGLTPGWSLHLALWLVASGASLWLALHYEHPGDVRYRPQIERANVRFSRAGYANREKIFIGAMFYNNEGVIPYWSESVIKVIWYLGPDNVFVSVLESESDDRSPELLRQLNDRLGAMRVQRRILTQDKVIQRPNNLEDNNRTVFLSALRNRVLEPLVERGGYDKVIFSNDVFVEPETILELLYTADGEYDMACGMDYGPFGLYDMWVLRDKRGRLGSGIWPYFFDREDYEAMKTESPVPVFTCWNGIVMFKADPVLPIHLRSNRTLSNDALPFGLPTTHPAASDPSLLGPSPALTPALRFRTSAPGECFSSESFLLPYDFRRVLNLARIFVNPRVVVGYKWRFYVYFKWWTRHPALRWWIERVYDGAWMHEAVMVVGDTKQVWTWDGGDCHPWSS